MLITLNCHAKVNLGLFVKGKRPDGYHNIETAFVPVHRLYDVLTVDRVSKVYPSVFTYEGLPIPGRTADNLVQRAYQLMAENYDRVGHVSIHLNKRIPLGSGLGGGSSDAAGVIKAINQLFSLDLGREEMAELGARLGSDVPFFFYDEPMYATGRGEQLAPISLPAIQSIRVLTPGLRIATAEAYSWLNLADCHTDTELKSILNQPTAKWPDLLVNDFQPVVLQRYPQLRPLLQSLYAEGADYAALSGSGSALFGLYL
ncbi:MAG: 4-(cytidine 5'-diphospho)-2-C-methyl-D-erythritol kinase [Bacteroidetes bacterium]|jgi:4-diphosphocytidyl-2-C-methyl-D-erythritol kinase|nr:4-(cytidine 5'-diphospho)-2-C-methyl-D-erythritol kinase [Bacteroidota bacterium]